MILALNWRIKDLNVQRKATGPYFPNILSFALYKVVRSFNKSLSVVIQSSTLVFVCGRNTSLTRAMLQGLNDFISTSAIMLTVC